MKSAPVVILSEPSDESQALLVAHTLEGLGVRCWLEGLEAQDGPSRSQALSECRAIVVVVDEDGGAYGALDAGATWKVPVFILGRDAQKDRAQLRPFCERVAAAVGSASTSASGSSGSASPTARRDPLGPLGRGLLVACVALGVFSALGILGVVIARRPHGLASAVSRETVGMTASQTGAGWVLSFQLPAPPAELWYEIASSPGFHQTGVQPGTIDPKTGAPFAKSYATVGPDEIRGPTTVRVKFRRSGGSMEGPFEIPFDPDAQALTQARSALEDMGPHWVAFNDFNGQTLVYFTPMLTFKHALREIQVSLDGGPPERSVRFSPSRQPGVGSDDEAFRALPPGARSVSIELVFRDGSRLPVRTFPVVVERAPSSPPVSPHTPRFMRPSTRSPQPGGRVVDPWATRSLDDR